MGKHYLIFHLHGLKPLLDAMGRDVTQASLKRLGEGISIIYARVLHHMEHRILPSSSPDYWIAEFVVPGFGARAYPSEQSLEFMLSAAKQLGNSLARIVFGGATARLANLRVALITAPEEGEFDMRVAEAFAAPQPCCVEEKQLEQVIRDHDLRHFLQPIVHFADGSLFGYEALTRGPANSQMDTADQLFDAGAYYGLSKELELACITHALQLADRIPRGLWLTVNLSSEALLDEATRHLLARPGIVVEITEHLPLVSARELQPAIAELRAGGALLALDDAGCGYADLKTAEVLKPDLVKLCITVIRSLGGNNQVIRVLNETIRKFHGLGIRVLAEGVETEQEDTILHTFEIDYAQGWRYGKAQPAELWLGTAKRRRAHS